ncbi:MAG: GNAT family N-acetyltransferase [Ferruginibacter sp.]
MIEIKKADLSDIEVIRQLTFIIWPPTYIDIVGEAQLNYMLNLIYSPAALKNQIENLHHQFIILYEDNRPLGFASYSPKSAEQPAICRLHKLYVLPDQHRKGFGKLLTDFIIAEIYPSYATELELNVNRQNPAISFYKKLGFKIKHSEDIDIGKGYFMNDYVMALKMQHDEL